MMRGLSVQFEQQNVEKLRFVELQIRESICSDKCDYCIFCD